MYTNKAPTLVIRSLEEKLTSATYIPDQMEKHNASLTSLYVTKSFPSHQQTTRTKPVFECPQKVLDPGSPMMSPKNQQQFTMTTPRQGKRWPKCRCRTPLRYRDTILIVSPTKGILKEKQTISLSNLSPQPLQKRVRFNFQQPLSRFEINF